MITFHYEQQGNAHNPVILFLHGFMGQGSDWTLVVEHLSNDFYCVTVDLPGHGKTTCDSPDDYTISSTSVQLISLMNCITSQKINLVGYSMGGRLAYYLAVHYPDMFQNVIIESAVPGLKTDDEKQQRMLKDRMLANRLKMEPYDQFLDDWYSQPLFATLSKQPDKLNQSKLAKQNNNPATLALSLELMSTGSMPSLWASLNKINANLLLIAGEEDSKFKNIADDVHTICPNATVKKILSAGHNVHLERTEEYIKLISAFLQGE